MSSGCGHDQCKRALEAFINTDSNRQQSKKEKVDMPTLQREIFPPKTFEDIYRTRI